MPADNSGKLALLCPVHHLYLGLGPGPREILRCFEAQDPYAKKNIESKQNNNEDSNSGNNSHLADCENPYKAITPRLPEVELYKFGVQSTKIKSEARELIESFPITNENYPLVIESLVERYGRNE
ncbi:hypothetical protein TNCV_1721951 [Trichonephila clavipes]|nr:hypothetical protein TNCV_1721951 [Trichonephila clavipes]